MWVWFALLLSVGVVAEQECKKYTNGCGDCVKQTWLLGVEHCGFCYDKGNTGCMDG